MKKLLFMPDAWEDFEYWLDHDPETAERIPGRPYGIPGG